MSEPYVLNAGGAHVNGDLLDQLYLNRSFFSGAPSDFREQVHLRSHPLQAELFAPPGRCVAYGGLKWMTDDRLALDVILLEVADGSEVLGRLEGLYPTCPVCLEFRLEKVLRAEGLLKARPPRALIHDPCRGQAGLGNTDRRQGVGNGERLHSQKSFRGYGRAPVEERALLALPQRRAALPPAGRVRATHGLRGWGGQMNRRSFLKRVVGIVAAAFTASRALPQAETSTQLSAGLWDNASHGGWAKTPDIIASQAQLDAYHRLAYNRPPYGMDYKIDPPDGVISIKITNVRSSTGARSVASLSNMKLAKR